MDNMLRKCLQAQRGERTGSSRRGSGFWVPAHAPHEGSSGTDGSQGQLRALLVCAKAAACLQLGAMTAPTLTAIKQPQRL